MKTLHPAGTAWAIEERYEDVRFFVRARMATTAAMAFEAFKLQAIGNVPGSDAFTLHFYRDDGDDSADVTDDVAEAEVFLQGTVRFDGCANVRWVGPEHLCGRPEAVAIGALLVRLYVLAARLMPEHAAAFGEARTVTVKEGG